MVKRQRQSLILELIEKFPIDTQEELQQALSARGLCTTQATLSRDMREMRITKARDKNGVYRYLSVSRHSALSDTVLLGSAVESMQTAGNLVVVKCQVGMAQAVCAAVDSLRLTGLIGTLAGEDTFLCIAKTEPDAERLLIQLKSALQ